MLHDHEKCMSEPSKPTGFIVVPFEQVRKRRLSTLS